MESRYRAGLVMASSTRSGGGVGWRGDGVQVLGCRGLLVVALLFVTAAPFGIEDVQCSITTDAVSPAPSPSAQPNVTFNQFEADALNAVYRKWKKQNPQLSTILNWSLDRHPCDNRTAVLEDSTDEAFEGAWTGVGCTSVLQNPTEIPKHYHVSVTYLMILGSNLSCQEYWLEYNQCGFDGIVGQLPSEISNLTNLGSLSIYHNPRLTGSVPVELFQMPNLTILNLVNNSLLSGTLPSDVYNSNCKLEFLDLSKNKFSGSLRLSPNGTLFCSSLWYLNVGFNQLEGPLDLQDWNGSKTMQMDFSSNHFRGTFCVGPYLDALKLNLSCNDFSSIIFTNHVGSTKNSDLLDTRYMPSLQYLCISKNNLSGPFPEELLQMPRLSTLDLSMNNFFGSVDFGDLNVTTRLRNLNFSYNNFNGTFFTGAYLNPSTIDLSNNQFNNITFQVYNETTPSKESVFLPSLEKLYFQNNNFSGRFPDEILRAPSLEILNASQNKYQTLQLPLVELDISRLSQVFITNNELNTMQYSNNGRLSSFNLQFSSVLFLGGNPICNKIENTILSSICRMDRIEEPRPVIPESNTRMKVMIATPTSSTLALVLLVGIIYVWRLMGRIKALGMILEEFDRKEVKPNLYSYKEIKLATNNFDKDNKLGEGGFGVVYKGELSDGTQAAVKKLTMSSNQVLSEFLNEVVVISGLKHCNLVKLKGCCLGDGDQRILVFEYVENNNLAEALWRHGDLQNNIEPPCLDWQTRFNIIVGIARGLAYLHEELQPPIIHRDIKATNILLDRNYNAKIADFGLAYLFPSLDSEASHLTLTQIAGTRGYCSPEYALQGHVSTALDVYSFGILVLEIVSGRKNIDLQKPSEEIYLQEWAWKQYEAKSLVTLIDQEMEHSAMDLEVIMRVLIVALACVDYKAARRPKMHDVKPMLFGNMSINQFQTSFEFGDKIDDMNGEFPITLDITSSLWSNKNLYKDDCVLLSKTSDLEMNSVVK